MPPCIRALLTALVVTLTGACSDVPNLPLSVGLNPWVGFDPFVLASERRLIDPTRIKIVELPSNSESQRNLRNGLLDVAALTLDEALRLADEGVPIRIIAVLTESSGADAVLGVDAVATPAALKGRRIAVEDGAIGGLMLGQVLKAGGLTKADVSLLRVEASQHEGAMNTGWADAVITFEPMRSRLLAQGFQVIFDSSMMPAKILDVLVVRDEVLHTRADDLAALLKAWERGVAALHAEPDAAAEILAPGAQLTVPQYLSTMQGLNFVSVADSARQLSGRPAPLAEQADWLVRSLSEHALIRAHPDWNGLLAPAPARAAGGSTKP